MPVATAMREGVEYSRAAIFRDLGLNGGVLQLATALAITYEVVKGEVPSVI